MNTKTKLKIVGMHCSSCAMNIDFDLEDMDGVLTVKTSYAKQETEIEFDSQKISLQTIVEKIKDLGYRVDP